MATVSPKAPKLFQRKKSAEAWIAANNPHQPDTSAWQFWVADFYFDQADRHLAAAGRWLIVAGVCMCISFAGSLAAVVIS